MSRIISGVLLLFLFNAVALSAEEVIQLDSLDIQEYKGRSGIWTTIESQAKLNYYLKKFYITAGDVQEINGTVKYRTGKYFFIPYSEKYLLEIESQGIKRDTITSRKNDFIWPLSEVIRISSAFGQRGSRFHTGADMPATRGTPIIAVMDGRVLLTGFDRGNGWNVILEHRDSFYTRYAHCYKIFIKPGDYVKKGQVIALVGSTGHSTGNHLHFEIRYNDIPLNPLDFLPAKENIVRPHSMRNWK
ncbi:MAG: M23 family metallopeptidase [Spirochaetes bacterium]|nr:M23 family metallopeptidase [Spirochaetota bacterium]